MEAIGRDEAGGGRKRLQKQQLQKENKQENSVRKRGEEPQRHPRSSNSLKCFAFIYEL